MTLTAQLAVAYENLRRYEEIEGHTAQLEREAAERERTEISLREAHGRLSMLVQKSPVAIIAIDPRGVVLAWNPAAERLFGWTADEVIGHPIPIVSAEERRQFDECLAGELRGEVHNGLELRRLRKDGSLVDVGLWIAPLQDAHGKIVGTIKMFVDISDRKRAEAERDKLLARLQFQIERMPLAFILFNADFRVTDWNPAAERLFGYTRDEALGMQPNDLNLPTFHQQAANLLERIRAGDMAAHSVNENLTKDGRTILCEWFNTPLLTDEGRFNGLLCLGQDVTEKKQVETERECLHQEVQRQPEVARNALAALDRSTGDRAAQHRS